MAFFGHDSYYLETPSQVTATNSVDLGSRRFYNGSEYLYVYNAGGASITSGYGVIMSAMTQYSVTVSSATQTDAFAGVAIVTIPTANYGWVLTKGFATIVMGADNSAAVGNNLMAGSNGLWAVNSVATGYLAPGCGRAIDAMASGASGRAYVRGFI